MMTALYVSAAFIAGLLVGFITFAFVNGSDDQDDDRLDWQDIQP